MCIYLHIHLLIKLCCWFTFTKSLLPLHVTLCWARSWWASLVDYQSICPHSALQHREAPLLHVKMISALQFLTFFKGWARLGSFSFSQGSVELADKGLLTHSGGLYTPLVSCRKLPNLTQLPAKKNPKGNTRTESVPTQHSGQMLKMKLRAPSALFSVICLAIK